MVSKDILNDAGLGIFARPGDVDSILNTIAKVIEKFNDSDTKVKPNLPFIERQSREEKTKELIALARKLTG